MRILRLPMVGMVSVALVGGGLTAAAQEPTATDDLLPGVQLVTEEVEPGVFRVQSDGVHELSRPMELDEFYGWAPPGESYRRNAFVTNDITASEAGVWLRRPEGIVRLGDDEPVWVPDDGDETPEFSVAPDGTLYQPRSRRILEGDGWEKVDLGARGSGVRKVERIMYASDGSLWVQGYDRKKGSDRQQWLARRDADGWSRISSPPPPPKWLAKERERVRKTNRAKRQPPRIGDWGITPDGTLYVTRGRDVQRFDGTGWQTLERKGEDIDRLHLGPDGAVWVVSRPDKGEWHELQVVRVDTESAGLADFDRHPLFNHIQAAGPDGTYWYAAKGDPMTTGGCGGITRFDGTTTTEFLEDLCIYDIATGPDGGVWLQAGSWDGNYFIPDSIGPVETYVIHSGAAAPAE